MPPLLLLYCVYFLDTTRPFAFIRLFTKWSASSVTGLLLAQMVVPHRYVLEQNVF